jgi:DNA replication and repair protein RecF
LTINTIHLSNFRNYREFERDFVDGINVITGRNAQGKTNLIEAVYYLASGRSFRARADRELILFGADSARVRLGVTSRGREIALEARLVAGKRRELYMNGAKQRVFADIAGRLTAVLFCPEDLEMVQGGAAARRPQIYGCLSQLRPKYAAALAEYTPQHDHKTRILRDHREKPGLLDALDEFNVGLARVGAELIRGRAMFTRLLAQRARDVHADFSSGAEELDISYRTATGVTPDGPPSEIARQTLERMIELRPAELAAGQCLTGPHRDDLVITINGLAARQFASQGQARTAAVSLKLAEREIHAADTGETPVLLLDDVLSELDEGRQAFLLERIRGGQVFITSCDARGSAARGSVTLIEGGRAVHGAN